MPPAPRGAWDLVRAERGAGLEGHQGLPDVAQRPQRPKLLRGERRLLAWRELLRQGLVHLPLRLKERRVVLDQVGPIFVDAVQTHRVGPKVVQKQRGWAATSGAMVFVSVWSLLTRRARVDLQRSSPPAIDHFDLAGELAGVRDNEELVEDHRAGLPAALAQQERR